MTEELRKISKKLSKILKKDRYEHTLGVMYTSASLAMCYGADIRKAMTAGLLHDCGKYLSADDQISFCKRKRFLLQNPNWRCRHLSMQSWEPIWRNMNMR